MGNEGNEGKSASEGQAAVPNVPEGTGEAAGRRRGLDDKGGQPLTEQLEDGQLRGVDEEGRHTTGTHGGPTKDGSDARKE